MPSAHTAAAIAALTLMTGAFLLAAGALRLSFLQKLFPIPVFVGYLAGTGVTIVVGQIEALAASSHLAIGVGVASIAAVLALRELAPRVPGPFVVLLIATLASVAFDLEARGVEVIGASFGSFALPGLPTALGWSGLASLALPALGLALIIYVDAIANANMLAREHDPPLSPRREFFALGAATLASGVAGGFAPGTSSSRSIVGIRAGEQTKLAGAVAGVLLVLSALSIVRFLEPMPLAALAGVVIVAAADLVDWRRILGFWRLRQADFVIAVIAALGVALVGMIQGIAIGIVVALAEALRRGMTPHRTVLARTGDRIYEPFTADAVRTAPATLVYRFGAGLFFGNADDLVADMREVARSASRSLRRVVINADALAAPDATAADALVTAQRVLARAEIRLELGNARAPVRAALERLGGLTVIDEDAFLAAVREVRGLRA